MSMKSHPDKGGDVELMKAINIAKTGETGQILLVLQGKAKSAKSLKYCGLSGFKSKKLKGL